MQETLTAAHPKVIDFAAWRARKAQGELPLFARTPAETSGAEESLITGTAAARTLLPREIAHREKMLRFLRSTS
jgi:hypothetical protein